MAVIQLMRQQQVTSSVPQPSIIQPQPEGPDPVVGALSEGLNNLGDFTQKLGLEETKQLDALYRNNIAAEISQFETDERARLMQLEAEGSGDKPFVTAALEGFEERAAKLGTAYSQQYRDEIKAKLLPVREQIAVYALNAQQRKINDQVLVNADTFQNNLVNQVRFGVASEQIALAQTDEFLATVPDNMRIGIGAKMREQVRVASMGRAMEASPDDFMRRVRSGEFNDVDSTYVERMYESAASTIVARAEKAERAREKIIELADKDPLLAARQSLALKGILSPTRDQLFAEQKGIGVPAYKIAAIERGRALQYVGAIQATQTPDELAGLLASLQAEAVQSGEDWDTLQRNVAEFAKQENLPNIAHVIEVMNPQTAANYHPEYRQAVFEIMRDPKAGASAEKLLGPDAVKSVKQKVAMALEKHIEAKSRAGASPDELEADVTFSTDAAMVAALRMSKLGMTFKADMVAPPKEVVELREHGNSMYHVPADQAGSISEDLLDRTREQLLAEGGFDLPRTMPNALRGEIDIKRESGWADYNGIGVYLQVRGVPVYKNGKQVVKTWKELSTGIAEEKLFGPKPTSGTLRPPEASGQRDESMFPAATPGNIQLLPPPNL